MTDPIAPPALHHVTLKTTRVEEMRDFYATVLGMETMLVAPGLEDDPDKLRHTGMHHSAYEYGSIDDLLGTYVRLKAREIVPHACLDHGMTMSFYYVDPDGNSLELQFDAFGDWADSKAFVQTPAFAGNPIGIAVDPELIVAARDQGATANEIHARAYAGEFQPDAELDLRLPPAPAEDQGQPPARP
jgi:catechol 2,3-dioxygenase